METQRVGAVDFVCTTPGDAANILVNLAESGSGRAIHLLNAYSVALAESDSDFRAAVGTPAVNFPDGKPISWVSALRRDRPTLKQVRGPRLFLDTLDVGRKSQIRHFLLGSTPGTLGQLERELTARFPGVIISGSESPPFRELSAAEQRVQDERIRASGAQIVWVGLGTPKQDFETNRLAEALGRPVVAVGAAFDFAAGTKREAPRWMTTIGLEWLFRLATEPRRLWRRYLVGNSVFLLSVLRRTGREGTADWQSRR